MTEVSADKPLTPKREAFARKLLELGEKSAAYRASYNASGMQPSSVHVAACRLANGRLIVNAGVKVHHRPE